MAVRVMDMAGRIDTLSTLLMEGDKFLRMTDDVNKLQNEMVHIRVILCLLTAGVYLGIFIAVVYVCHKTRRIARRPSGRRLRSENTQNSLQQGKSSLQGVESGLTHPPNGGVATGTAFVRTDVRNSTNAAGNSRKTSEMAKCGLLDQPVTGPLTNKGSVTSAASRGEDIEPSTQTDRLFSRDDSRDYRYDRSQARRTMSRAMSRAGTVDLNRS